MKTNDKRGHIFEYGENRNKQVSEAAKAQEILFNKWTEKMNMKKYSHAQTMEVTDIMNAILDKDDEDHGLFSLCFSTAYGMSKMLEDYATFGLLKIDTKKLGYLKTIFADDFSEENINEVKEIYKNMTIDDFVNIIISYYGIALNNEFQLELFIKKYLPYNKQESYEKVIEKSLEILERKIILISESSESNKEAEIIIGFILDFINTFDYLLRKLHEKENCAITGFEFKEEIEKEEELVSDDELTEEERKVVRKFAIDFADAFIATSTNILMEQVSNLSSEQMKKRADKYLKLAIARRQLQDNPINIEDDNNHETTGKRPYTKK